MKKCKTQEIKHAQDIYNLEPLGAIGIAAKLRVHQKTVERWAFYGVPETYWAFLRDEYGVTPFEIVRFNDKIIKRYKGN